MNQNKQELIRLRTSKSKKQQLAPRKTICRKCPHQLEVKEKSCHIGDIEMLCLEEPHICHSERDGLCRGVVEKMLVNNMSWETI